MVTRLNNFLEPAMFCHLAVLIYLCGELTQRQGKRPNVYAKQKEFKNFFKQGQGSPSYSFSRNLNFNRYEHFLKHSVPCCGCCHHLAT